MSRKQRCSIRDATARVNIFEGAIRSGKTFSWLLLMLENIATATGQGVIVIVGKNRDSIYRNVFEPLFNSDAFALWRPYINYKQGAATATFFGRVVHVIGANDAKSESRIRGATVLQAWVDEITVLDPGFFKQLLGRMSLDESQLFGTTNPDSPACWLKRDFLDRMEQMPNWRRFHFVIDDNPSLSETTKQSLRAQYTGLWYRRFILGEWVAAEGAVYDMWDTSRHVIPWAKLAEGDLRIKDVIGVGVDYGTTNPTAALMLGLTLDNRLVFMDEWRYAPSNDATRLTDQHLSAGVRKWLGENHLPYSNSHDYGSIVVDPAAASFRVQLREDGLHTHPAENDVLYGIRTVSSLLTADKLLVTDRCKGWIEEAPGYSWSTKATLEGKDEPVKLADHCLIGGTRVETEHGEIPIECVPIGEKVWTRKGLRTVTDAWETSPNARVCTITFSDGNTLTGTPNHRVWVSSRGWVEMEYLRYGDRIVAWPQPRKPLSTTGSSSDATLNPNGVAIVSTTHLGSVTSSAESNGCTKKFGWTLTGLYRKATTSITGMKTHSTTTSRIWNAYRNLNITDTTWRNGLTRGVNRFANMLREFGRLRLNGIAAKRDANGIASTDAKQWRSARCFPECVTTVAMGLNQNSPCGSVQTSANRPGGASRVATTYNAPASIVEPSSPPIAIPASNSVDVFVISVQSERQRRAVYDLTVEDAHEFFANGVLVHNSLDAGRYACATTERNWRRYINLTAA